SVWARDSGEPTRQIGHFLDSAELSFSSDGQSLLLWGGPQVVKVAVDDGQPPKKFSQENEFYFGATLNSDESRLLTRSLPEEAARKLLKAPTEKRQHLMSSGVVDVGGFATLWNVATGDPTRLEDATGATAQFSQDGNYVYAICGRELVRFWDA